MALVGLAGSLGYQESVDIRGQQQKQGDPPGEPEES